MDNMLIGETLYWSLPISPCDAGN